MVCCPVWSWKVKIQLVTKAAISLVFLKCTTKSFLSLKKKLRKANVRQCWHSLLSAAPKPKLSIFKSITDHLGTKTFASWKLAVKKLSHYPKDPNTSPFPYTTQITESILSTIPIKIPKSPGHCGDSQFTVVLSVEIGPPFISPRWPQSQNATGHPELLRLQENTATPSWKSMLWSQCSEDRGERMGSSEPSRVT